LFRQWALRNIGQSPSNGTFGADISAQYAWEITNGSEDVVVAVLDTGIPLVQNTTTLSHPDLQNANRIILGLNFANPSDPKGVRDLFGHGTHVAGIVGAEANNSSGISGTSWESKILVIQTNQDNGFYTVDAFQNSVIYASDYAVSTGKRVVINFSSGGLTGSQSYIDAINYAAARNVLIVAITHNDGLNNFIRYPARYASSYPNVIAVGATDHNDNRASYSNAGSEISLVAPGGFGIGGGDNRDIYSTLPNYQVFMNDNYDQNYDYVPGTSMAAPHVSAVAGLILSINPNLNPSQVRAILQNTADKVGSYPYTNGFNQEMGHGRLNAYEAVLAALPIVHNHHFNSDETLSYTRFTGANTVDEETDLTIPAGKYVVLEGSLTGTFDAKLKIYGTMIVEENALLSQLHITVYNGGKLIIRPGAKLLFRNNQQLNVQEYAILEAIGTPSNPIIFDKATGSNWRYLYLKGSAVLKYVDIANAQYGIYQNNVYETSTITDSKIRNSSSFGYYGVYGYLYLVRTLIENSGSDGINANNYTVINDASIYDYNYWVPANVVIRNNGRYGVYSNTSSQVLLSEAGSLYGGYNSIYGNTFYDLYATNNSEAASAKSWWGQYPPNTAKFFEGDIYSTAYYGYPLNYNPNALMKALSGAINASSVNEDTLLKPENQDETEPLTNSRFMAKIAEFRRKGDRIGLYDFVKDLSTDSKSELNGQANLALILALNGNGDYISANSLARSIFSNPVAKPNDRLFAGVQLFHQWLDYNEFGTGEDITSEIPSIITNLETLKLDSVQVAMYRDLAGIGADKKDRESEEDSNDSNQFSITNFPNPFNPTTEIRFNLPVQNEITLKVFDMIGREVAVLIQERMDAGLHTISFNASNLSSGIYMYRLQIGNSMFTQKMTLLK